MKWKYFVVCFACLLLLTACKKTPQPEVSVQSTTVTTVQTQEQKKETAPSVIINGTHTVEAGTCQWSRVEDGDVLRKVINAPHPYEYFSEKHLVLYADKNGDNTVALSYGAAATPKKVKVVAFKMSEDKKTEIPLEVTKTTDKDGVHQYTFTLLDDDFYAYTAILYWDRYEGTDYAHYPFYSKVK